MRLRSLTTLNVFLRCAVLASVGAGLILQQDQALAAVSGRPNDLLTQSYAAILYCRDRYQIFVFMDFFVSEESLGPSSGPVPLLPNSSVSEKSGRGSRAKQARCHRCSSAHPSDWPNMRVDTTHLKLRRGDRFISTPSSLLPASTTIARREAWHGGRHPKPRRIWKEWLPTLTGFGPEREARWCPSALVKAASGAIAVITREVPVHFMHNGTGA